MVKNKFALLGEKLGHSYSPLIHNYYFKLKGIDAEYELCPCEKENVEEAIKKIREGYYQGMNVTIPYKVYVMDFLDEISEEAKIIGAVNTIVNKNGKLIGYNTDYYGFLDTLVKNNIDVKNKEAYILGSGGASKAVYAVLNDLGANPYVISRKDDSYCKLSKDILYLLVNTTPIGMYPNCELMPVSQEIKKKAKYIIDVIYNPLETSFMKGHPAAFGGLYMLVSQAVKSLELWLDTKISEKEQIYNYVKEVIK